jgi:hypothetical protein
MLDGAEKKSQHNGLNSMQQRFCIEYGVCEKNFMTADPRSMPTLL